MKKIPNYQGILGKCMEMLLKVDTILFTPCSLVLPCCRKHAISVNRYGD